MPLKSSKTCQIIWKLPHPNSVKRGVHMDGNISTILLPHQYNYQYWGNPYIKEIKYAMKVIHHLTCIKRMVSMWHYLTQRRYLECNTLSDTSRLRKQWYPWMAQIDDTISYRVPLLLLKKRANLSTCDQTEKVTWTTQGTSQRNMLIWSSHKGI